MCPPPRCLPQAHRRALWPSSLLGPLERLSGPLRHGVRAEDDLAEGRGRRAGCGAVTSAFNRRAAHRCGMEGPPRTVRHALDLLHSIRAAVSWRARAVQVLVLQVSAHGAAIERSPLLGLRAWSCRQVHSVNTAAVPFRYGRPLESAITQNGLDTNIGPLSRASAQPETPCAVAGRPALRAR